MYIIEIIIIWEKTFVRILWNVDMKQNAYAGRIIDPDPLYLVLNYYI